MYNEKNKPRVAGEAQESSYEDDSIELEAIQKDFSESLDQSDLIRVEEKPVITVSGGGLSEEATSAELSLINAGCQIYQRDRYLVRPVIMEVDAAHGRKTKIAQLVPIDNAYLQDILCRKIEWQRYDARSCEMKQINPPSNVAKTILARYGDWKFPRVIGVITTQTLRPDGSVLQKEGYDPATRLILVSPPSMPLIPDAPTKQQAIEALRLLEDLLQEFPFVDDASESVALSAILTVIARGAFKVVPMHATRATTAGSGKSYLFDIVASIAIGQICPVMAAGRTEEETEKRLGAALISGQPIISVDNVNGDLGGDALCQAIERPIVDVRILGKSEKCRIESKSTIFATGNNLRLVGDMTRRVLLCTLDAEMERPELKQFKGNPVEAVMADRGKYVAAALVILRAYIAAGRPNPAPRLASFEEWSNLVRSALIWLGKEDPVKTMEAAREEDPYLQSIAAIFSAIEESIGVNKKFQASELVTIAEEQKSDNTNNNQRLYDAILTVASDRGRLCPRKLGRWLGKNKGRIYNKLRLNCETDNHGHTAKWELVSISG